MGFMSIQMVSGYRVERFQLEIGGDSLMAKVKAKGKMKGGKKGC
jgi:hypothetical protein